MGKPFGIVTKSGKVIGQDILDQYAIKNTDDSTPSRRMMVDSFNDSYRDNGLVQPLYNPEALARVLEINTYHYRACKTKARDIAGLGWEITPMVEKPSDQHKEMVEEFFNNLSVPLSTLLDRAMLDFEATGYGVLELIREEYKHDGQPVGLGHIPSHTMRIHESGNKFCQIRGKNKRWFKAAGYAKDVNYETGDEHEPGTLSENKRASEVVWLMNYTPRSDYYGLPDHIPALGAVHGDMARRDFNITFFDNFGVPAYAVFITGNFDPGDIDSEGRSELEKAIEEHFAELSKNPHSTLILTVPTLSGGNGNEVKIEFKPLATDVKEASFRLYRKDNRDEVLAAHGVPPYRLGIAEEGSLGGSTAAESTEIYKMSVIKPRQEVLESLVNRWVLQEMEIADYWWELAEVDNTDEKHDLDAIEKLFDMGAISPNQIARYFADRFGLEEDPENEALNTRYVKGQPVGVDPPDVEKAIKSLESLQEKLLEVAVKGI